MRNASTEDFALSIVDVFNLTGRGPVVVGPVESGVLRTGETVEVWDGDVLLGTAAAQLEFVCSRPADPRSVALLLSTMEIGALHGGQVVRRRLEAAQEG